ncbi:hypothetical protein LTR08_008636 [Meristemomyces frigidus]|nr:hypothetical protein LTR08_008636 [Meristemomyces frigidus]
MADARISPHALPDLKSTTDDALANYLRSLHFRQHHAKLDVRLALGYLGVAIAAATFAADYRLGWDATKRWTAVAVCAYAVVNGGFSWWIWQVEGGCVFEGVRGGKKISIASKTNKHDPTYHLAVTDAAGATREVQAPFTAWFTADGFFVARPFQQWLARSVGAIGEADAKNAASDAGGSEGGEIAAESEGFATGSGEAGGVETKGKGGKRLKRKG